MARTKPNENKDKAKTKMVNLKKSVETRRSAKQHKPSVTRTIEDPRP
jgi:hypothetical protein